MTIGFTHDNLASVKEACVLAMLRISSECEEVPEEVIERVKKVAETAGKFLRRVWRLFIIAEVPLTWLLSRDMISSCSAWRTGISCGRSCLLQSHPQSVTSWLPQTGY